MGGAEVNAFLTDLAGVVRARQKRRLPVVLSEAEVWAVLERMDGVEALVSEVLYGSGCSPSTSAGAMTKQESRDGIISIQAWCKRRFTAP